MKYVLIITILLLYNGFGLTTLVADEPYRIKTVVIDPGHGGHDPGCLGPNSREKHIALSIALKLGKMLKEQYPDIRVIYTRETDKFVELHERASIANRNNADVFICLHANAAAPSVFGTETFVMGLHKSDANLELAKRENSAILMEEDYETNYNGFDPNSDEANIIFSLYQNTFLDQSILLAQNIQSQFSTFAGRHDRGVKQAGLLVLWRTTMPAVLIEAGFITNQNEEAYLLSKQGQDQIAKSILRAFSDYKIEIESVQGRLPEDTGHEGTSSGTELKNDEPEPKNSEINVQETVSAKSKPVSELEKESGTKLTDTYFTVQIGAIMSGTDKGAYRFKSVENAQERKSPDGIRRYTVGEFSSLNEARIMQKKMRSSGFHDAFITGYSNGEKVSVQKVTELLRK